jgi:transposase
MARQRSHSIEFKRQVAQEFVAGETLYALAKRYDVSRNLIRVWVKKLETGVFDDDANAADLLVEYEAKIAALERAPPLKTRSRAATAMKADDREIVAAMTTICDEFEAYGFTSVITGPTASASAKDAV